MIEIANQAGGFPNMHRTFPKAAIVALTAMVVLLMTGAGAWAANTYSILHNFDNTGYFPKGNLIFDSAGNIYGTTVQGGLVSPNCSQNCGVVFELTPSGGGWTYKTIYSFTGGADGGEPTGNLALDSKGNLYGATTVGGAIGDFYCRTGCGTVYELSPSNGGYTFALLYSFSPTNVGTDGETPVNGVILDNAGNVYGTTADGGSGGAGTIFELSPSGGVWNFSTLYAFPSSGKDGAFPSTSLALDQAGNLYGATSGGGSTQPGCLGQCGVAFELSPAKGSWNFSLLHIFKGPLHKDGASPWGNLVVDAKGNVFGATVDGGNTCNFCGGTVFKLSQSAGVWKEQILHRFSGPDGQGPLGGVTIDKAGNLYGTTNYGGTVCSDCGTVFKLTLNPKGTGWKFASLYSFSGVQDGIQPFSGVIMDTSGNLYGTTTTEGPLLEGTLFELSGQ